MNELAKWLLLLLMAVECGSCSGMDEELPKIPREFRAAWIATVKNIDWPSERNLTSEAQQVELLSMIDKAAAMNLNAIVLQIRPMADALYRSELEPWSEFLTGQSGRAPEPFWDPLEFAITACHERGMELHAWFNPYRALEPSAVTELAESHVSKVSPDSVHEVGKYLWMDPAEEATKAHTLRVILDVVERYQVDGVHIDDYFYPYPSYSGGKDFPDEKAWQIYIESGGGLERGDWRRWHVNDFVERFYSEVKAKKRSVKVGISPFGIWRSGHPAGIRGMDQYAVLFADAKLWLNRGWVDYFTPQLYWELSREAQSYPKLLAWWVKENSHQRHIWPGNFTSKIGVNGGWPPEEIEKQIEITRKTEGASGNVHFSMIALAQNRQGVRDRLGNGVYEEKALVPASPWLSDGLPSAPTVEWVTRGSRDHLRWQFSTADLVWGWVIYQKVKGEWNWQVVSASGLEDYSWKELKLESGIETVAIRALNPVKELGAASVIKRP